jgi:RNA polymerase sigma factor (TIGR02999 family)
MDARKSVTRFLEVLRDEGVAPAEATDQVFSLVYDELRRLAERILRSERRGHTLQPTALVNEAYLKLVEQRTVEWRDRAHFLGIAARAMRQILVDHARRRSAAKRGGGWQQVTLDDAVAVGADAEVELLALDDALEKLAANDERVAQVAEMRLFGGLTVKETAHVLGVSPRTVDDDWAVARMWLTRELGGEGAGPAP